MKMLWRICIPILVLILVERQLFISACSTVTCRQLTDEEAKDGTCLKSQAVYVNDTTTEIVLAYRRCPNEYDLCLASQFEIFTSITATDISYLTKLNLTSSQCINTYQLKYSGHQPQNLLNLDTIGTISQFLPGRKCTQNGQCLSLSCIDNACQGYALSSKCSHHSQCSSGLFCNSQTLECEALVAEGSSCTETYECQLGLLCGINSTSTVGYCYSIYSLSSGESVQDANQCQSGYYDTSYKCISPASKVQQDDLTLTFPFECSSTVFQKCNYRDSDLNTIGSASCFCSSGSVGFCPLDYTSEKQDMNLVYASIEQQSQQCHTMERSKDRRMSVYAMASCGPGILDSNVQLFLEYEFNYTYYMFANNPDIAECYENVLYTSLTNFNLIMKAGRILQWMHGVSALATMLMIMGFI